MQNGESWWFKDKFLAAALIVVNNLSLQWTSGKVFLWDGAQIMKIQ